MDKEEKVKENKNGRLEKWQISGPPGRCRATRGKKSGERGVSEAMELRGSFGRVEEEEKKEESQGGNRALAENPLRNYVKIEKKTLCRL